eukprot:g48847.t1
MVLYFIGLGLGDEKDITVRGLEVVRKCKRVFLESYTAILGVDQKKLEAFYQRKLIDADRNLVESSAEQILEDAQTEDIAFLVVGDPLAATTHTDLFLRAAKQKIRVEILHNASIMNAVAVCGLQLYQFGQAVSIPFFKDSWRPTSWYEKIKKNKDCGFHTMCLLDIKTKEPAEFEVNTYRRGLLEAPRPKFLPPRFMAINQAIEQLLEAEATHKFGICTPNAVVIGLARVGQASQRILTGSSCPNTNPLPSPFNALRPLGWNSV